jgi:hypothetical protein
MQGLVHEDGAGDFEQIKGDEVGGLLAGSALCPWPAEPGPVLKGREVQSAGVPDHQLGVDDCLDTERGRGTGDFRKGRAKICASPRLEVRLGTGEHKDSEPVGLLLEEQGPGPGWRQSCHGARQHRLDRR